MDQHGGSASQKIKKQIILPILMALIGVVVTIKAVVKYKNYEEAIARSGLELNAMTYAEHRKAGIVNGISVTSPPHWKRSLSAANPGATI